MIGGRLLLVLDQPLGLPILWSASRSSAVTIAEWPHLLPSRSVEAFFWQVAVLGRRICRRSSRSAAFRACPTIIALIYGVGQALSLCFARQLRWRAAALICQRCLSVFREILFRDGVVVPDTRSTFCFSKFGTDAGGGSPRGSYRPLPTELSNTIRIQIDAQYA
jgi:hypothetical protein